MSNIIQGIIEGRERENELAAALKQARQITKGVKYDDTIIEIISEIQTLASKLGIDPRTVKYAINDVLEARNSLESAVYALDEMFKDAYQDEKYKNDEEEEGLTEENKAEIRAKLDQAIKDFLARGGQIEKLKPNRVRAIPGMGLASKHIGTAGEINRKTRSKMLVGKGRNIQGNKPVVNVEEGNLAAIESYKKTKESNIMKGLQSEEKVNEYELDSSRKITFSKENPPTFDYLYRQFIHTMLSSPDKLSPEEWISFANKRYGLNHTYKDFQNFGKTRDNTGGWDRFIKKYILNK